MLKNIFFIVLIFALGCASTLQNPEPVTNINVSESDSTSIYQSTSQRHTYEKRFWYDLSAPECQPENADKILNIWEKE